MSILGYTREKVAQQISTPRRSSLQLLFHSFHHFLETVSGFANCTALIEDIEHKRQVLITPDLPSHHHNQF
jgi:hypothetical protein